MLVQEAIQEAKRATEARREAEERKRDALLFAGDLIAPHIEHLLNSFGDFKRYDNTDDERFRGVVDAIVSHVVDRGCAASAIEEYSGGRAWLSLAGNDASDIRKDAIITAVHRLEDRDGAAVCFDVARAMARQFCAICGNDESARIAYSALFGMAPLAIQIRIASKETESARTEEEEAIAKALRAGASLAADGSFQEEEEEAPEDADDVAAYYVRRSEAITQDATDVFNLGQRCERDYLNAKRAREERSHDEYMKASERYHTSSTEMEALISRALRIAYDAGYAAGTLAS